MDRNETKAALQAVADNTALLPGLNRHLAEQTGIHNISLPTPTVRGREREEPYLEYIQAFPESSMGLLANNFHNLTLEIRGRIFRQNDRFIWFNCGWQYQHKTGGSNGISLANAEGNDTINLWFDRENQEWLTGRQVAAIIRQERGEE